MHVKLEAAAGFLDYDRGTEESVILTRPLGGLVNKTV
jgi:hypothetical protein